MTLPPQEQKALVEVGHLFGVVGRWLGSLKLAVILLVVLAVVLACTTIVEKHQGPEYVLWHVYRSRWFMALLGLLSVNVLAAVLVRFPSAEYFSSLLKTFHGWLALAAVPVTLSMLARDVWTRSFGLAANWRLTALAVLLGLQILYPLVWYKKYRTGFVIAHVGLLMLLGGALLTFLEGIEGQLSFAEGDTEDTVFITDRCLLEAVLDGEHGGVPIKFGFSPGPADWAEGKTLDFGETDGVGLSVLGFYRHARAEVSWGADESGLGWPALEFALTGPGGDAITRRWLAGSHLGGEVAIGPANFELLTASSDSMLRDFLEPPRADAGQDGVLSICCEDRVVHVDVKENVGKKVPAGKSGVSVEIVEYLADAARGPAGRFVSRGTQPRNPMLELLVHLPGRDEPIREIAFARFPALTRDAVHGGTCPVKFWYYHPAVSAHPGAQFLQTPDGRLYCRVGTGGKYVSRGEVKEGDQIETWAGFSISLLRYLPRARRQVTFHPVPRPPGGAGGPEAAALVEVRVEDQTEQVWMQRNDQEHGVRRIQTPQGLLLLTFGYDRLSLGFSLELLDFKRGRNPGRIGDASFASSVQLIDPTREIDEKREISMNHPLVHDQFTFYQSRFRELADGSQVSVLSVSHDPGRFLKYLGSLMICVGTLAVFYLRPFIRRLRILWAWLTDGGRQRPPSDSGPADSLEAPSAASHGSASRNP